LLHLHDWQAMPAVLLRDVAYAGYPRISGAAVMSRSTTWLTKAGSPREQLAGLAAPTRSRQLVKPLTDGLLLLREGVKRAELVNTVSPGYAAGGSDAGLRDGHGGSCWRGWATASGES